MAKKILSAISFFGAGVCFDTLMEYPSFTYVFYTAVYLFTGILFVYSIGTSKK